MIARRILLCGFTALTALAGPAPRIVVIEKPAHKGAAQLEKRSREALKTAGTALRAAHEAYRAGDGDGLRANATRVEQAVDLAYHSLANTGKDPREEPKHFKRAEVQIHDLYRRVEFLQLEMALEDRSDLDRLKNQLRQVQNSLLHGLINGSTIRPLQTASAQ